MKEGVSGREGAVKEEKSKEKSVNERELGRKEAGVIKVRRT